MRRMISRVCFLIVTLGALTPSPAAAEVCDKVHAQEVAVWPFLVVAAVATATVWRWLRAAVAFWLLVMILVAVYLAVLWWVNIDDPVYVFAQAEGCADRYLAPLFEATALSAGTAVVIIAVAIIRARSLVRHRRA